MRSSMIEAAPLHLVHKVHPLLHLHVAMKNQLHLAHDLQGHLGSVKGGVSAHVGVHQQLDICVAAAPGNARREARLLPQKADLVGLHRAVAEGLHEPHAGSDLLLQGLALADEGQPHGVQDVEAVAEPQVLARAAWPLQAPPLLPGLLGFLEQPREALDRDGVAGRRGRKALSDGGPLGDAADEALELLVAQLGIRGVPLGHERLHRHVIHLEEVAELLHALDRPQSQQGHRTRHAVTNALAAAAAERPLGVAAQQLSPLDGGPEGVHLPRLGDGHLVLWQRDEPCTPALGVRGCRGLDLLPHRVALHGEPLHHLADRVH
mmetsp:Transcript_16711/g.44534  ORF Transcript_16711/g.44534 Transcript_16711/m.44534 type:complete len:320 (+) Transcript_16711:141-1100(+)